MVVTLSNFQIDFGRPGFVVSGAQAPGWSLDVISVKHQHKELDFW